MGSPHDWGSALLELAIEASDPPLRPDQYRFIRTHAWWLGSVDAAGAVHHRRVEHRLRQWVPARPELDWLIERELTGRQEWLPEPGGTPPADAAGHDWPTGRFRAPFGDFSFDGPEGDFARTESDGAGRGGAHVAGIHPRPPGSWQSPGEDFMQRLPREPGALLARLRDDNPGSWFTPFAAAVTVLRTCLVPADLRVAFYRALTGLPDVVVAECVENLDGRACHALVHDAGRTRTELMIDPADGQFAGERDTLRADSRAGLRAGTVISTTATRTAVVDALGDHPPTA